MVADAKRCHFRSAFIINLQRKAIVSVQVTTEIWTKFCPWLVEEALELSDSKYVPWKVTVQEIQENRAIKKSQKYTQKSLNLRHIISVYCIIFCSSWLVLSPKFLFALVWLFLYLKAHLKGWRIILCPDDKLFVCNKCKRSDGRRSICQESAAISKCPSLKFCFCS